MGRIADEKIQEIRDRVDIVEVVSGYLPLKRSGVNYQGLCPFHQEKTPSFNVNASRQIFHCFGCGVGGNVFSFLMRMDGLSFPDAVRRIGEKVGIEVEEEEASPAEIRRREARERLARINGESERASPMSMLPMTAEVKPSKAPPAVVSVAAQSWGAFSTKARATASGEGRRKR